MAPDEQVDSEVVVVAQATEGDTTTTVVEVVTTKGDARSVDPTTVEEHTPTIVEIIEAIFESDSSMWRPRAWPSKDSSWRSPR